MQRNKIVWNICYIVIDMNWNDEQKKKMVSPLATQWIIYNKSLRRQQI